MLATPLCEARTAWSGVMELVWVYPNRYGVVIHRMNSRPILLCVVFCRAPAIPCDICATYCEPKHHGVLP